MVGDVRINKFTHKICVKYLKILQLLLPFQLLLLLLLLKIHLHLVLDTHHMMRKGSNLLGFNLG